MIPTSVTLKSNQSGGRADIGGHWRRSDRTTQCLRSVGRKQRARHTGAVTSFVLASGSPRRRELLSGLGTAFDVVAPDIDESALLGEAPADYVERISREKADAVSAARSDACPVLAADTCVVLEGRILGKPSDADDAAQTLKQLSGRTHSTITGVTVLSTRGTDTISVSTEVEFGHLELRQIEWYVGTGEPLDKAGSYAIQGLAASFIRRIEGSHSNVIGLPLAQTAELLAAHGVAIGGRHD